MGNSSSSNRISDQDRAILDMKIQRDNLQKYQKRIETLTNRETEIAKEMLAKGDKKKALLALRKKKYQESLLAKTDSQLEQLEKLTRNVEFALISKDVAYGIQQGTKVLEQINKEMGGLEKIEQLMGENAEAIAYQREVSEMLGGKMTNADEDEVEDELAALEAEVNKTALPAVPDTQLPERVPEPVGEAEPSRESAKQAERREMVPA